MIGGPKDRHEFISALRASRRLIGIVPRPYGRGYCMTALRALKSIAPVDPVSGVSVVIPFARRETVWHRA